jgi:hypothetical protein
MESRRLVVWISAGILGFQGATLAFDLLNCTVLSWLFVRQHGLGVVVAPLQEREPEGHADPPGVAQVLQASPPALQPAPRPQQAPQPSLGPAPTVSAFDPTGVFCAQPRSRIDEAVSQGLTILAGLALGSSVGGGVGKQP